MENTGKKSPRQRRSFTSEFKADYYAHWALTHFLLDGHHKMEAAAREGRPLRLLSLLAVEASLATPELVMRVPELRNRAQARRA